MKKTLCIWLIMLGLFCEAQIPYNQSPDWESNPNAHVATGLALADIDNDGWKDMVVANGNDISIQSVVVYYNDGAGNFPANPDWSSTDTDYHGHCAAGDLNNDGWIDVVTSVFIGQAGFSEPGRIKVYLNNNGTLESTPSFESETFYSFSCDLGDADGDGDLDIAVACGEIYNSIFENGRIFYNDNGAFQTSAEWKSDDLMCALDVEFADVDDNGFLDVVFVNNTFSNAIFFADDNGVISTTPGWQSQEANVYINSVDFGFTGQDKNRSIVMTGNDQVGGDGKLRAYSFMPPIPSQSPADWLSNPVDYGSGIILSDVNLDGLTDIVYGGWWYPMEILLGNETDFDLIPAYTSSTSSVVEAIQIADLDRDGIVLQIDTLTIQDDRKVIYLSETHVDRIIEIRVNDVVISAEDYISVPDENWISFANGLTAGDEVIVLFDYTKDGDIAISNWDSNKGNYIFYNTNDFTGMEKPTVADQISFTYKHPNIEISTGTPGQLTISNTSGQVVRNETVTAGIETFGLSGLADGIYFAVFTSDSSGKSFKFLVW